jgi:predicted anti-sigma-YlaC factor YlaD
MSDGESHGFAPGGRNVRVPTCRDMSELVTDYMERATPAGLRLSMWWHLLRCDACRRYFDQMRRTVAVLGRSQLPPPDANTEDSLVAAAHRPEQRES